jgi:hypothetical protein
VAVVAGVADAAEAGALAAADEAAEEVADEAAAEVADEPQAATSAARPTSAVEPIARRAFLGAEVMVFSLSQDVADRCAPAGRSSRETAGPCRGHWSDDDTCRVVVTTEVN